MRVTRLFAVSIGPFLFAVPALAQQPAAPAPTRTVDDYVCAFSGDCSTTPNPPDNSIAAPQTRGFRVVPTTGATPAVPSSRAPIASHGSSQAASVRRPSRPAGTTAARVRSMDLRVSFLLGSAQLTDQAREEAKVFAKALLVPALSSGRFRIEGHTDSSGSRAMNLDLSRRRAQAVADYLSALGVPSSRLEVRGYGPDRPLPGHSPASPENRRVEAELL
jgi:outer membrane protein OmpA-like peptidoglycan-associated protein